MTGYRDEPAADVPDIAFALDASAETGSGPGTAVGAIDRARNLAHRLGREVAAAGPPGWRRAEAVFALTVEAELASLVFVDEEGHSVPIAPGDRIMDLAREQRRTSAGLGDGPWWRMVLGVTDAGEIDVDYDYGDEPFPDDQLFPPEIYRADLETYPRASLPVWLAAYLWHDAKQLRPPRVAATHARSDRAAGVRPISAERGFPELSVMSARWAVIAAAFTAVRSVWGPRVLPALRWFEGARRSGSTLYVLPGGRAVLSGGVWNAPALQQAYNSDSALPSLYAGAPHWVVDAVLNPRAANGLLSFCYWWEGGHWFHGGSPLPDELAEAVPGIWTSATVTDVVAGLISRGQTEPRRAAVAAVVDAAERHVVTRESVAEAFGTGGDLDLDGAFQQLDLAGIAADGT